MEEDDDSRSVCVNRTAVRSLLLRGCCAVPYRGKVQISRNLGMVMPGSGDGVADLLGLSRLDVLFRPSWFGDRHSSPALSLQRAENIRNSTASRGCS